jgi:hypothetical protein
LCQSGGPRHGWAGGGRGGAAAARRIRGRIRGWAARRDATRRDGNSPPSAAAVATTITSTHLSTEQANDAMKKRARKLESVSHLYNRITAAVHVRRRSSSPSALYLLQPSIVPLSSSLDPERSQSESSIPIECFLCNSGSAPDRRYTDIAACLSDMARSISLEFIRTHPILVVVLLYSHRSVRPCLSLQLDIVRLFLFCTPGYSFCIVVYPDYISLLRLVLSHVPRRQYIVALSDQCRHYSLPLRADSAICALQGIFGASDVDLHAGPCK